MKFHGTYVETPKLVPLKVKDLLLHHDKTTLNLEIIPALPIKIYYIIGAPCKRHGLHFLHIFKRSLQIFSLQQF